jgi:hypothetical protein
MSNVNHVNTSKDTLISINFLFLLRKPENYIWVRVIRQLSVFLWLAIKGRLKTNGNNTNESRERDAGSVRCTVAESINHIVLCCKLAEHVWRVFSLNIALPSWSTTTENSYSPIAIVKAHTCQLTLHWVTEGRNYRVLDSELWSSAGIRLQIKETVKSRQYCTSKDGLGINRHVFLPQFQNLGRSERRKPFI